MSRKDRDEEASDSSNHYEEEDDEDKDPSFLIEKKNWKKIGTNRHEKVPLFEPIKEYHDDTHIKQYCENQFCKEDVFSACPRCNCLLCFKHFMEDELPGADREAICGRHGTTFDDKPKESRKRSINRDEWKLSESKKRRNSGKSYSTVHKKKSFQKRK